MDEALDESYLQWLYEQVENDPGRSRSHFLLVRQLFRKEFVPHPDVLRDENRVSDGRDLRYQFVEQARVERVDASWMGMGCSMLEMLIALSRELSFDAGGSSLDWFWHLMENLDVARYDDRVHERCEGAIDDILDRVINRTYGSDGVGGLFPLRRAKQDMREVEIWYQLNAYLIERDD